MIIKKFQGKTEEEATAKAKEELGLKTVIMNVKEIRPKGILRMFKSSVYEVTAALEEEEAEVIPSKAMMSPLHRHDTVNMVADEKIVVPAPDREAPDFGGMISQIQREKSAETNGLEEKLETLQNLLEKKLVPQENDAKESFLKEDPIKEQASKDEGFVFVKMLYGILLENEVNEKYVNQIMDENEKIMRNGMSVDFVLSNIYQKMILKLGQPKTIELSDKKPKVAFFIGPTGVGKTTTIAKIASKFKVEHGKRVALLTADTYRIAAAEQLRTYANILDTPLTIVYSAEELNEALERVADYDLVLIDTAGFSHRNQEQREEMKKLIDLVDDSYEKEIYLVLSATTKYRDLVEIADIYKEIFDFRMVFTKLDETSCYGNIFNMKMYTGADLSYSTYGQNVPEDIEVFDTQKMVKMLLGGK
ncbi:MAG: flagellar biosynthesis protein FlhF [Lachnospiraceae bacterium]|nr:flagellar biosynthesis protein FlhF [Lachnospiraceae bacterium]